MLLSKVAVFNSTDYVSYVAYLIKDKGKKVQKVLALEAQVMCFDFLPDKKLH